MKILSFLGPSNYSETTYKYRDTTVLTRFFAEALPKFFPETEKILVFVTPTVREHQNLRELKKRLGDLLEPVDIPESHTEDALWHIFDALVGHVNNGERVIFDITNSFRSLPFLVFIAAAFLRSVREVKVEAVVYGAFEARDQQTNISPVFDLSPFVSLFDWLAAANQFIYTGNARYLASQLAKTGQEPLYPLADNVTAIAQGLELLRPRDVAEASLLLPGNLKTINTHLPKPFSVVVQSVEKAYVTFGVASDAPREHLVSQLRMVNWYFQNQHYVHTLAMAREWVVSLLCMEFQLDMWDKDARAEMEFLLNNGGIRKNTATGEVERESLYRQKWLEHPHRKRIARLWQGKEPGKEGKDLKLANLRNDVLHTGFRKNPKPAAEIIDQAERIVNELNEIALLWELVMA